MRVSAKKPAAHTQSSKLADFFGAFDAVGDGAEQVSQCIGNCIHALCVKAATVNAGQIGGLLAHGVSGIGQGLQRLLMRLLNGLHAIDSSYGAHVKKGVAEYLNGRINSGLNQIQITGNQNHPCLNSIEDLKRLGKKLVKVVDFYGRETTFKANVPLIYIYSDGTVEKVVFVNE